MPDLAGNLREFVIQWNNYFPLDRWWRERYKIPFGSAKHLEVSQIDILIEYIESSVFEEHTVQVLELVKKRELYKKEGWISKNDTDVELSDDEFEKIAFNEEE